MLDTPARQASPKGAGVGQDLVRPLVARPHRDQQAPRLVGLVDGQRVVRDELCEGICDPVQQGVETLLGEHVVKDVRQAAVRLDPRGPLGRVGARVLLEQAEWECVIAHGQGSICLYGRSGIPFSRTDTKQSEAETGSYPPVEGFLSLASSPPSSTTCASSRVLSNWPGLLLRPARLRPRVRAAPGPGSGPQDRCPSRPSSDAA